MPTATLARTPAGPVEAVPNLKRRQQRIWWREHTNPDGTTVWLQTKPLPDDLGSREQYRAKGFRMNPPGEGEDTETDAQKEALLEENARLRAMLEEKKKRGRPKEA